MTKLDNGRPSKYEEEYCEEAIDYVGNKGKSVTQLARHLQVAKSTVYLWAKQHPDFSDALTCARDWSEAYWEDKFIDMMVDKEVNSPLVKLYFANRFKWTEKQPEEEKDKTPQAITINLVDAVKPVDK